MIQFQIQWSDAEALQPGDLMPAKFYDLSGMRVMECAAAGIALRNERDVIDLIGEAFQDRAAMLVVPVERLDEDFFRLSTGLAGEIVQKFVNYRLRLAIVGDISRYVSESTALRDFVRESNRGNQIWFVTSRDELAARLSIVK